MGEDLSPRPGFGLEHMLICPAASGLRVEAGLQGDRTKGGCSGAGLVLPGTAPLTLGAWGWAA